MIKSVKDVLSDDFWIMPATPEYLQEGIPYITSKNIKNGVIDFSNANYISQEAYDSISKNRSILCGDILISMIGTLGETAEVTAENGMFYGQNMFLVRLDERQVNKRYFLNYFNSSFVKRSLAGSQNQSTQKYLKANHIENLQIPIPELSEQESIAQKLDVLDRIIKQRKAELVLMDDLIKARFVEMFGDPELGQSKYSTKKLGDLSNKISDGVHAKPVYTESGRPFLSVVNINKGFVDFTDCKFVSEEAYQQMIKSTNPEKGDVLYTKVGATYGIPAYVDTEIEFCLYVSVCLIKPKHESINSRFLSTQMGMPSVKHQADARIKGIGVPDLHLNQIREFDIICPPRELQEEFVAFVEQVDKSKSAVQKALEETQLLFDSLMQKYFG